MDFDEIERRLGFKGPRDRSAESAPLSGSAHDPFSKHSGVGGKQEKARAGMQKLSGDQLRQIQAILRAIDNAILAAAGASRWNFSEVYASTDATYLLSESANNKFRQEVEVVEQLMCALEMAGLRINFTAAADPSQVLNLREAIRSGVADFWRMSEFHFSWAMNRPSGAFESFDIIGGLVEGKLTRSVDTLKLLKGGFERLLAQQAAL